MTGNSQEDLRTFMISISLDSSHTEKYFRQSCRENQNTHFMSDIF